MMGRRRAGIKVYRAETDVRKRDRGSLSLFVLQSAALSILMALWWNAFLSVFRLPLDRVWLYGVTAAAVVLLGAADRRFGAAGMIAGIAAAGILLWYSRDTLMRLCEWIVQNQEVMFSEQAAGQRAYSYVAVLVSVPVLEILLLIQRTGRGRALAGLIICAPFLAAACVGWFQTVLPSWLLILGAVLYFASSAAGAGRTGSGLFLWRNAVFAVAACTVLAVLSYRAGTLLDTGREAEGSLYYQARGMLTAGIVDRIQDLTVKMTGEEPAPDDHQADTAVPEELSGGMQDDADDMQQEQIPDAADPDGLLPLDGEWQDGDDDGGSFEGPSLQSRQTTDLGRIARFTPASDGVSVLVLEEKPESTVYFAENVGIVYSDDAWEMTGVWSSSYDPEAARHKCISYPEELTDTLSVLCSGMTGGTLDEVSRGISRELQQRAVYDTEPGAPPAGEEFLHYFLFENHKGFCVHFATAATLMYRYCGYTARYAEGYAIPASAFREKEDGQYEAQITGNMGHAWCQVYDEQTGEWTDMEHTPSAPEDMTGRPPAASADYRKSVGERVVTEVLPVLGVVCLTAGVCAGIFFAQAAVRSARREQRFRRKKDGAGIRAMYEAVIKTAKSQGEKISDPLDGRMAERLYELYPELGEEEWRWMYSRVMQSLFYHLDDETRDWEMARRLYARFRKAALGQMSRGKRWRYRYVRCL